MSDHEEGYYVLSKHIGIEEPYHWVLKAPNHEVVLTSEMYKSKQGALNGIDSVQRHCEDISNYTKEIANDGSPYFNLKANNHEIIGTSQMYKSEQSRDNGINAVKKYGSSTILDDKSKSNSTTNKKKEISIIINGREYSINTKDISYDEILSLGNIGTSSQNSIILVVFERAENDKEGTLAPGDKIKVKDGMVFNVSTTNKS